MACEGSQDDQIGEALLKGVIRHQLMNVATEGNVTPISILEVRKISNIQDQKLVEQLAETIKVIGDKLDQDTEFNDMFDGLVKVSDKSSFWKLVEEVFKDGQINWGRIVVLFYSVGKLAAKMVLAHLPRVVSDILTLSLDYFRRHLLDWICKMGGWINSIPALARFSIERFSGSSPSSCSLIFGAFMTFTSGALLGALIVWRLHKTSCGLLRAMRDQVQRQGVHVQPLPEPQPMNDEQEQLLVQMAEVIRFIGDDLDRDPKFNNMVDGFARVADRKKFQKLVDQVFSNDITWGRIVTLICLVSKSIVKMLVDLVSGIVSWTLDYFNDRLLHWICNHGGWVNSISSLACYSFERDAASSDSLISPASGLFFVSGLLLGGYIVWRMNRCA